MTRPLSRMTSMTSARPLGRGVVAMDMRVLLLLLLVGLLGRQGLLRLAHQLAADVGAVLRERARNVDLVDPVQVPDGPVELLERVLGGPPVAVGLTLFAVGVVG